MSRPKLKTIFICLGLFIFFYIIRFPMESLRSYVFGTIYKQTGAVVTAEDLYLSIFGWPGVGMVNVDASIPMNNGSELNIYCKKLVARVGLGGIFPPRASYSVSCSGLKKGGDAYVKATPGKSLQKVYFSLDKVELSQFFRAAGDNSFQGIINGEGSLVLDGSDLSKSSGAVNLDATKLKTPGQNLQGIILPTVNFGDLKTKLAIKSGVLEVNSFQIGGKGSDISGSISGDVRLGKDIYGSELNITLRLQLSEPFRANPNSATIVSLLDSIDKSSPGNYAMKWSTSIQGIVTNLWNALPQKVN